MSARRSSMREAATLRLTLVSLLTVLLLGTADGRQPLVAAQPGHDAITDVVAALLQHVHGTGRGEWRTLAPSAAWHTFNGSRDGRPWAEIQERGLWCAVASDAWHGVTREAVFYGLRDERLPDCHVEHIRYVFEPSSSHDIYASLSDTLSASLGRAGSDAPDDRLAEFGVPVARSAWPAAQRWRDFRYWSTSGQFVFLFRTGATVQLHGQSYILTEALRTESEVLGLSTDRYGVSLAKWEAVNAIRSSDPDAAVLIADPSGISTQPLVEQVALRLLRRRSQAASADDRAMLTLAAAFVVGRLFDSGDQELTARPGVTALLAEGVTLEQQVGGDAWVPSGSLLDEVLRVYPRTRWGQLAFYERLSEGWNRSPDGDQYRHVITQGQAWLRRNPRSSLAIPVMSLVARAYETWWSLSLAPPDEELVQPTEHAPGSREARRQAIVWYERILQTAPSSREAAHARRVLIHLRVEIDTGERLFYHVYA